MKKTLTILCLLLSFCGLPQKFSISVGGTFPLTDLGGGKGEGKRFLKDLNFPATGLTFSGNYHWRNFRVSAGYSYLKGADTLIRNLDADNVFRYDRKQYFKTSIAEINAIWNPFITRDLFATIGAGIFYARSLQPQIVYGGGWQINSYLSIELLYRYTFTDYLDGYTSKWSKGNDNWFGITAKLSYRNKYKYLKCAKI